MLHLFFFFFVTRVSDALLGIPNFIENEVRDRTKVFNPEAHKSTHTQIFKTN